MTDIWFKHPFSCIVSGPSGSGMLSFTLRLVQYLDSLCTEPHFSGGIIWCYSEKSAVPRQKLTSLHKNVSFHEGVPQNFGDKLCRPCVIILDCCMCTYRCVWTCTYRCVCTNIFYFIFYFLYVLAFFLSLYCNGVMC